MITVDPYVALAPDVCDHVIAIGRACPRLRPGHMKNADGDDYVAPRIRRSSIAFLTDEEIGPLAAHLRAEIERLNAAVFRADLDGRVQFQFAQYDGAAGEFINWHCDEPLWDGHFRGKKVSLVIQLSHPDDYDGGVLEVEGRDPTPRVQGLAVAFPAFAFHRVTPVTRGMRFALVVWALGPHWR